MKNIKQVLEGSGGTEGGENQMKGMGKYNIKKRKRFLPLRHIHNFIVRKFIILKYLTFLMT
jgi:hypothetical protein